MRSVCLLAFGLLLPAGLLQAQSVIAQYPFMPGDWSDHAESPAVDASNINNAAGGSITSSNLHFFKNSLNNAIPESFEAAYATDHYIGFTLTPTNHRIGLQSLTFDFGISNDTSSVNPYVGSWAVLTSATGFSPTVSIASGSHSMAAKTTLAPNWVSPSPSINLSTIGALQDLTDPVEIRIYFWDNSPTGSSSLVIRIDTIEVTANTESLAPPVELVLPTVTAALVSTDLFQVSWDGLPGLIYTVETSSSPRDDTFTAAGSPLTLTEAGPLSADIPATGGQLFVRVRASLPASQ